MKKVLSLLLVCAMIFSLAAFSVSAAGESYAVVSGTYDKVKSGKNYVVDYTEATTAEALLDATVYTDADYSASYQGKSIVLTISTAISNVTGGFFAVDYDSTKVFPAIFGADSSEVYTCTADSLVSNDNIADWIALGDGVSLDDKNTKVGANTVTISWYPGSAMAQGTVVAQISFATVEGVTADSFDADTFKVAELSNIKDLVQDAQYQDNEKYGASYANTQGAAAPTAGMTFTYPGSDVTVGGGEPDPVYTWGSATDVVADETGVTGTKVAVFGKVSGGAGKVLADNEYWVTFNENTYFGGASDKAVTAWAIVIYDPNGEKIEAGRTYNYKAGMTGVEEWSGSVTASAVAE